MRRWGFALVLVTDLDLKEIRARVACVHVCLEHSPLRLGDDGTGGFIALRAVMDEKSCDVEMRIGEEMGWGPGITIYGCTVMRLLLLSSALLLYTGFTTTRKEVNN